MPDRHPTTLLTCSVLALAAGQAWSDCTTHWDPPQKVFFKADLNAESWLALEDSIRHQSWGGCEKNVAIQPDGSVHSEEFASSSDYYEDAVSESWAYGVINASVSGQTQADGFEFSLALEGLSDSYNGSTEIKAETTAQYAFEIMEEARFGFISWDWDFGPDVEMEAWLVNLENGHSFFMNGFDAADPDDNPTLQPGAYMVELNVRTTQSGCEEDLELGGVIAVELSFSCPYFTPALGDINKDQVVNGKDLALLVAGFKDYSKDADLNEDGAVDGSDLALLLGNWSK